MHSRKKTRPTRTTVLLLIGGGLLCGLALSTGGIRTTGVIVAACGTVVMVFEPRRALINLAQRRWHSVARSLKAVGELLLYLSPIAMLSVAYPIASHRLNRSVVSGVPLTTLLLAASVTVPWLTQTVCLPLYQAVAPYVAAGELHKVTKRLCELWPMTFLQCLPVVLLFAVPVELSMRWSLQPLGTYLCLCVLYLAFAQSLILSIVYRRRGLWAAAWAGVAISLLIAPTIWFLPPLVGLATQLVPLRHHWYSLTRFARLHFADVATDVVRGLLLGAVLWADKYLLFLKAGNHFAVTSVYMALLPAVLAYNYYFVRLAPRFDASVTELRGAMEEAPYDVLIRRSRAVYRFVTKSLRRSAFVGACIAMVLIVVLTVVRPGSESLVVAVAIASWLAMMITLLCYQLDYIGQRAIAQVLSGAYLAICAAAFLFFPLGAAPYVALIGFDVLLFAVTLRITLDHWRSPEYSLFWRHATAW